MNYPIKYEKESSEGGIFFIPLFLPDWAVRKRDDLLNYRAYKFPADGMYAFGRVIYHFPSNYDLIEVFRYTGSIPAEPDIITRSGRLFAPVCTCMGFGNKRYRFIFTDERYDKVRDSAYDKITFLMNETDIWVGGKQITVGREKRNALKDIHQAMIIYSPVQLEVKIRAAIKDSADFNYEEAVNAVLDSLPKPREKDAAFKKRIAPFRFLETSELYNVYLDTGSYKSELFEKRGLSGNSYDWTQLAETFIAEHLPKLAELLTFDPEAGTFSVSSKSKKAIKEFAEAFKAACDRYNAVGYISVRSSCS
jgi:hypothetical protein